MSDNSHTKSEKSLNFYYKKFDEYWTKKFDYWVQIGSMFYKTLKQKSHRWNVF